jgi:hypothetical protein
VIRSTSESSGSPSIEGLSLDADQIDQLGKDKII